ncbi:MAG: NADH-quinone oxidoreductase subunit M [Verrucomicrobia bacterium]|nr:NADH-quinone oxidoreductase subunit M [Verrucomicrobiota bacterium]MBI3870239.1 NADH-quinone oxidoreductase subunit M [Verrucomicrobiota bacterium]
MLVWTLYICLLGGALQWLLPSDDPRPSRVTALFTALAALVCALGGSAQWASGGQLGPVDLAKASWIPQLGIQYHLAVDGISLTLIVLTGLAAVAGVLFSWNVRERTRHFFGLYFLLLAGCFGVFLSFDLFLLFAFYELAILPKYFLIAMWGSKNRDYASMKLALYSFAGSAMVLVGIIAAHVVSGGQTFDLAELAKFSFPETFQYWAFPLVFVGFAILAGLWPFHTWAPTGHSAAPTAASMLLAGVVMKLGAYGALRVAITLFPAGALAWRDALGALAVVGIVYGAVVALTQRDFKFVIGYSSVSHMGFVLLGLASLTTIGLSGAVLQMFSHGIIGGLLFAVVGRMVYDRTHTRDLDELSRLDLARVWPFAAGAFVLAALASMGVPGFSGFVPELKVLVGAWQVFPTFAVLSGIGILVGVAYTLRVVQRAFFAVATGEATADPKATALLLDDSEDSAISVPERFGAALLIGATLFVGLQPRCLLDWIVPAFQSPLFEGLRKAGGLQ